MDVHGSFSSPMSADSSSSPIVALCASCDRCRARKTKCDGNRPCGNCAAKYLKKNKLSSMEGVDLEDFECVYSPAKRRGPVPGKVQQGGQTRKSDVLYSPEASPSHGQLGLSSIVGGLGIGGLNAAQMLLADQHNFNMGTQGNSVEIHHQEFFLLQQKQQLQKLQQQQLQQQQLQQQQLQQQQANSIKFEDLNSLGMSGGLFNGNINETNTPTDFINNDYLKLLQQQQQQQILMANAGSTTNQMNGMNLNLQVAANAQQQLNLIQQQMQMQQHQQQRNDSDEMGGNRRNQRARPEFTNEVHKRSDNLHLELLESSSVEGARLRSFYDLSINELLNLPPVPTDSELALKMNVANSKQLESYDLSALRAARYAELALGAFVSNQINLALELSNSTVACLRECVEEPVSPQCMFDVARAYFLHAIFRSYRGDTNRYFKYRRVCLTHLYQMENIPGVEALLAAVSFHDSWAYITHNADQNSLPDIDQSIPRLPCNPETATDLKSKLELGITSSDPSIIACNPDNQMWIQGPPPIFINNEAPALSRSLDALACAVRTCCDQANNQFECMVKNSFQHGQCRITPTGTAVMANEKELCSRNMVISAYTLLQQHEACTKYSNLHLGHHMIISAMDAFLENHENQGSSSNMHGFTDSQVQSLLSVCNSAIDHPLLLYQPGPIYHMVSNATILLVHLLNAMHANLVSMKSDRRSGGSNKQRNPEMESMLFDEALDAFISVRKVLTTHRRKLPAKLRCHAIPRPNLVGGISSNAQSSGQPFIDLGETLMCGSRGCQGFVLMACSPCVAAERAQAAQRSQEENIRAEEEGYFGEDRVDFNEFDKDLVELGAEFDLDDDALLNVLSRIITS